MRQLILCLAAVAAVSAYNLVIQELTLTGGAITSDKITCKNMATFIHVGKDSFNVDCYDLMNSNTPPALEGRKLVFTGPVITTNAKSLNCEIVMADQSTVPFPFTPVMKTGVQNSAPYTATYKPVASPEATTTAVPPTVGPDCKTSEGAKEPDCLCKDATNAENETCKTYCKDHPDSDWPACPPKTPSKLEANAKLPSTAVKAYLPLPLPVKPDISIVDTAALPPAVRLRGPGPARSPARRHPVDVTVDEDEEVRRMKREDVPPPAVDDSTISVAVAYYVLDEPGNPAAVWAAVIEGIILIVLVGACLYFFCWAPRNRGVASASADPYKPEGNYSVSYANSSYNNQRIDAFQNPPPAAPPRPANSAYMDDYITDNIGAMGRPAAAPAAPAATAASAANPATSNFEPRHQRFDSSGLVTVNLS